MPFACATPNLCCTIAGPCPPRMVEELAQRLLADGRITDACASAGFHTRLKRLEAQYPHARCAGAQGGGGGGRPGLRVERAPQALRPGGGQRA